MPTATTRRTTPPTRHPDSPRPVPPGIHAFALLLGLRAPDADEFRELGNHLTVGDPLADDLVDWMYADGMAHTRPLFERALAGGIAAVPDEIGRAHV